jgi:hypothetical protein
MKNLADTPALDIMLAMRDEAKFDGPLTEWVKTLQKDLETANMRLYNAGVDYALLVITQRAIYTKSTRKALKRPENDGYLSALPVTIRGALKNSLIAPVKRNRQTGLQDVLRVLSFMREDALNDLETITIAGLTHEQASLRRDVCEQALAFLGKL